MNIEKYCEDCSHNPNTIKPKKMIVFDAKLQSGDVCGLCQTLQAFINLLKAAKPQQIEQIMILMKLSDVEN